MVILFLFGRLIDYFFFRILVGVSFLILLSLIYVFVGVIIYWFNEWKIIIFIFLMLVMNFIISFDFFNVNNRVYGLDYEG